jgi:hypothetical protein
VVDLGGRQTKLDEVIKRQQRAKAEAVAVATVAAIAHWRARRSPLAQCLPNRPVFVPIVNTIRWKKVAKPTSFIDRNRKRSESIDIGKSLGAVVEMYEAVQSQSLTDGSHHVE